MACYDKRRAACRDGGAWAFNLSMHGSHFAKMYVADAGIIRMDFQDKVLLGINSVSWLSCMARCPESAITNICFPYALPTTLFVNVDKTCTTKIEDGPAWQGAPSKLLKVSCENGATGQMQFVPSLYALRDALVGVNAIKADNALAKLDGATVSVDMAGDTFLSMTDLQAIKCSAFAYPEAYKRLDSPGDFAELQKIYPRLKQQYLAALKSIANKLLHDSMADTKLVVLKKMGQLCLGKREAYDEKEVEKCLESRPDLKPQQQKMMNDLMAPQVKRIQSASGAGMKLMGPYIDKPLCEHFSARSK